ncbi:Radical SAM domain protein [Thermoproteus uzoniensis 768-20]|uniref:Radical SAM domain protein n=1 Tax=Thermoproteus uzoniensis (strain 768-20) TaxID=999630 RepID=F2L119_THEU7|nr:radical SAM protein [Thermoproteus uzoniensis]AEA11568.1 Radical SAM domain protein [Thermoproteus uzoniensis 768-20]
MSAIRPFDPWKNPLCPCPPKYGLNPYTGCGHSCAYCYISGYIPRAFQPRPKEDLLERVRRDVKKLPPGSVISLSNSSDPYTPPEAELRLTRRALSLILEAGHKVLIVTKSPLVLRDLDILSKYPGRAVVQITVTTLDERIAERLEPRAPRPSARLEAARRIAEAGIPVGVRLDPIVPYVNDSPESLSAVVAAAAEAGARQLVASTYKAKPDNFARLVKAFPEAADKLRELYWVRGVYMHGQRYAPAEYRRAVLERVKREAEARGLQFDICREEFFDLNTPGTYCDGSHLLR